MKIEYDRNADAAYIYLDEVKGVKKTVELNENIILDLGDDGKITGIEILDASKVLHKEVLEQSS